MPGDFDIVKHYGELLQRDEHLAMPVAAIESLAQVVARSDASTMTELISELESGAALLRKASFNPVSLSAGADLFLRFVTLQRPSAHQSFSVHKRNLVQRANDFVNDSHKCVEKIVGFATGMIKDDAVILTHSYSRVVTQSLLHAARQRKRVTVYVTEARPFGLGIKTHAILTKAGIPCQVILDSAVAFAMPQVDMVLLGAEALAENGGLINFIGGYQMALAAKHADKPVYALAESFKFVRLFPLNQNDVPRAFPVLQFTDDEDEDLSARDKVKIPPTPVRPLVDSPTPEALQMSTAQIQNNPLIDYTTPDLVTLVISDVGILTPSGVSDTLLRVFSG
ncbi:nagb/rpia/CoA transferase-like protein [Cystobasidium minutum MCA 4210]|uniref:nagb/rpia/CoA transferase-like protein n=1 Tax=Cystobasidium minutum MCA 4210 TaxID=1397322 RepID=UPI0034CF95DD|eukprot:jgi/Rhomi1/140222/e_gw1.1.341.1